MRHFCSFSEAIREGVKLTANQCAFAVSRPEENATCAGGAGLHAILGRLPLDSESDELSKLIATEFYYMVARPGVELPCGCVNDSDLSESGRWSLGAGMMHLNNVEGWTREAIANWLENEEDKLGFITLTETGLSKSSSHSLQSVVV